VLNNPIINKRKTLSTHSDWGRAVRATEVLQHSDGRRMLGGESKGMNGPTFGSDLASTSSCGWDWAEGREQQDQKRKLSRIVSACTSARPQRILHLFALQPPLLDQSRLELRVLCELRIMVVFVQSHREMG
jgi:hypothetical protein